MVTPWRRITGAEPDAIKVARPVLNGEREETGEGPRLALTQLRRCGYRRRLKRGVDMTSDVKGWEQLFYVCLMLFPLVSSIGRAGARKTRRLITLIAVGWLPPSVHPSGACLLRGTSVPCGLITPPRVTPHRGGVAAERG